MTDPNFIVIGGMKCGSTTLHDWLDLHPDISMSRPKELDFFLDRGNWHRGWDWYSSHFAHMATPIRGESSPNYSKAHDHPEVAGRIAYHLPDAKLTYIIRHPIERIISMWSHQVADGLEDRPFAEAVRRNTDYVDTSRYSHQLAAYPEGSVHVLTTERLAADPVGEMNQVFRFVGVEELAGDLPLGERSNEAAGRTVLTPLGRVLVRSQSYWRLVNESYRARKLHERLFRRTVILPRAGVDPGTWEWLAGQLTEDVQVLNRTIPATRDWDLNWAS